MTDVGTAFGDVKSLLADDPKASPPDFSEFTLSMTEKVEVVENKNLLWFNSANATDTDRPYFLILTTGNCGAIWYAYSLNLHEDIFSGCGISHPIENFYLYQLGKDGAAFARNSAPDHYRHGCSGPELMQGRLAEHGLAYDIAPRDQGQLGWYVFDELEAVHDLDIATAESGGPGRSARAIGSVHSFSAVQFSEYYKRDPKVLGGRRTVVTNMIRHPLSRTESFIKAFVKYHTETYRATIDTFIEQNLDECRSMERDFGVSMEDPRIRSVLFVYRIGRSMKWVADELHTFKDMHALKMESLQNDPDYFARSVSLLTSGRVRADQSYLDRVFRPENIAVGRRSPELEGSLPPDAKAQWELWSEWERQEFLKAFRDGGMEEIYRPHGYDFSFLR